MRFKINLTTRTYIDHRVLNRISAIVLSVLILLLLWNIKRIISNLGEEGRLVSEIKTLEESINSRPGGVSEKDFTRQQSRIRFFNEIIDRKSIDWTNMLEILENVTPKGIALSSLSPGKNQGELKLEGRAASFAAVRQYVENLEGASSFSDVLLLSHQDMTVGEKGRGVQFALSCKVQFR